MTKLGQIVPVLIYADIAAAHDFLVRAFGFEGAGVYRDAEGRAVHGEVRAGGHAIWLHRVAVEHGLGSPQVSDIANSGLFVDVDDVDAHYEHARSAGARIDGPPMDQPYGRREYGASDLEGHRWWFGKSIAGSDNG